MLIEAFTRKCYHLHSDQIHLMLPKVVGGPDPHSAHCSCDRSAFKGLRGISNNILGQLLNSRLYSRELRVTLLRIALLIQIYHIKSPVLEGSLDDFQIGPNKFNQIPICGTHLGD